ncbi:sterigmatocystin biosynthesis P450 monooxygenase StcS [Xylariomycetidae sp. FL2044]|nr:sterigmatocystin biosynthesis P450 monooxygenase StcS [Xylariomycetidae sp. FL2044]KAH9906078.1 sterigmatocystin biosynthesis P450 monooxygenase StcS [Xylariomycetidae sp. FL2044]
MAAMEIAKYSNYAFNLFSLLGSLFLTWVIWFFSQGFSRRRRFRQLMARGVPVMEPHSLLFGHLLLMKSLTEGLPKDAHTTYANLKIGTDWKKYFPSATKCPSLVYLDLWPVFSQPIILLIGPEPCYQLTQENPQPRHPMMKWALTPVTGGRDLISMDMQSHRLWRSTLNPAFSSRNLISNIPLLIEEVEIFADTLKGFAGKDGSWGEIFTLFDRTIGLTLDVIARVSLDLRLHEQTTGPGPLLKALRDLIALSKFNNLQNKIERLTPSYRNAISTNGKILNDTFSREIEKRLDDSADSSGRKTIVDQVIQEVRMQSKDGQGTRQKQELVEVIISQLKLFFFAGHDTTAQTLCWILYEINKYPAVMSAMRAEHDEVLGADPKLAAGLLKQSPHKLNELKYTSAVIKETLRFHNLGATFRQGNPNFHFVVDGEVMPTDGFMIQTNVMTMHLRPDLWPRVMEFLPERFMVSEGHPLYPQKNTSRPFEMGMMRCIGEELATIEMRLALVLTMRELDFKFDYAGWDKLQGRTGEPETVFGERGYRNGGGVGGIKDNMPTIVKLRS